MEKSLFELGMYWRIVYGVLRTLLGLVLLNFINLPISDLLNKVLGRELSEDPTDLLFSIVNHFLENNPLSITYFISAYLIFWGIVDIVLSFNLLKDKIWAFPVSLWLIGFFVFYELFRFTHTKSLILIAIIFIDIIIMFLIQREYKKVKLKNIVKKAT
jgi:uncharacterized membrane protein